MESNLVVASQEFLSHVSLPSLTNQPQLALTQRLLGRVVPLESIRRHAIEVREATFSDIVLRSIPVPTSEYGRTILARITVVVESGKGLPFPARQSIMSDVPSGAFRQIRYGVILRFSVDGKRLIEGVLDHA